MGIKHNDKRRDGVGSTEIRDFASLSGSSTGSLGSRARRTNTTNTTQPFTDVIRLSLYSSFTPTARATIDIQDLQRILI
jgi:hypothetical protein